MTKTITRPQVEAILFAAEAAIDRIPLTGVVMASGFTLDKAAVADLRDQLADVAASEAIFADDQDGVRWTVEQWAAGARQWHLEGIAAACAAALG